MCLIVFAWKLIPNCPLVVAANRDEFFARPTQDADWWHDHPDVYAGRDLQAGGTWLGVNRRGRFAALTNIRNGRAARLDKRSRGELVADYLRDDADPETLRFQHAPDHGHAEARVVDVGVARHQDDVAAVPAQLGHLFAAHRQKRGRAEAVRPELAVAGQRLGVAREEGNVGKGVHGQGLGDNPVV